MNAWPFTEPVFYLARLSLPILKTMRRFEPSGHHCASPGNNGNRAYQYYLDGLNVKEKRIPIKKRPIRPNKKVSRNRSPEVSFPNQGELRRAAKLFSLPGNRSN
jgi:hypothetical protein